MRRSIVSLAFLPMLLGFTLMMSTGQDDPYLTFWPAHSLAYHGEIANYNGERVEQSSSLLHTILIALVARVTGLAVPTAGYWLGVVAGVLAVLRAIPLSRAFGEPPSLGTLLLVGGVPAFVYWCFGSMETTLVSWLLVEVALAGAGVIDGRLTPHSPRVAVVSVAYIASRPEGALVLGATLLAWLALYARRSERPRNAEVASRVLRWLLLIASAFAFLALFRLWYFGLPFPEPVAAKMGGNVLDRFADGVEYFSRLARRPWASTLILVLAALPFVLWNELRRDRCDWVRLFGWLLVGANAGFIVLGGGDWMTGARFFAHFAPLGIVLGRAALRESPVAVRRQGWLVAGLIVFQLGGLVALALTSSGRPVWKFALVDPSIRSHGGDHHSWIERANRIRTRDIFFLRSAMPMVERILEHQGRAVIMSGQAGMVFYYLAMRFRGRVEFVDRFGLATRHVRLLADELGAEPGRNGLSVSLERFLEVGTRRPEPAWSPDLVFDILQTRRRVESLGYRTVYEQRGGNRGVTIPFAGGSFRYDISAYEYLAIREPLARDLALSSTPTILTWPPPREP